MRSRYTPPVVIQQKVFTIIPVSYTHLDVYKRQAYKSLVSKKEYIERDER